MNTSEIEALPYSGLVEQQRWFQIIAGKRERSDEELTILWALEDKEEGWRKIEARLAEVGSDQMNWDYIHKELDPLADLKGVPNVILRLEELRYKYRTA